MTLEQFKSLSVHERTELIFQSKGLKIFSYNAGSFADKINVENDKVVSIEYRGITIQI